MNSYCLSAALCKPYRIYSHLHTLWYPLSVRQQFCQVFGSKYIPQGGLSQQTCRWMCVGHIGHRRDGTMYAEVHNAIYGHCHRVFCKDLQCEKLQPWPCHRFDHKMSNGIYWWQKKSVYKRGKNNIYTQEECKKKCTSWGGMSNDTVLRSTLTKESVQGKTKISPGKSKRRFLYFCPVCSHNLFTP